MYKIDKNQQQFLNKKLYLAVAGNTQAQKAGN